MAEKQNLSVTRTKKSRIKDYCPVCEKDLYLNSDISKRVGLVDDDDDVIGWLCPYCKTEFDFDNKVVYIMGNEHIRGET
tara:strand:+ start:4352 stop:4588 length:237 start_codon:yes stop_codon:yes gene_type:complete